MTQALDAAIRAVLEAMDKSPLSLDDCADMFARAALRAALPAEPPEWFCEWWHDFGRDLHHCGVPVGIAYRALRAHLLGEDAAA